MSENRFSDTLIVSLPPNQLDQARGWTSLVSHYPNLRELWLQLLDFDPYSGDTQYLDWISELAQNNFYRDLSLKAIEAIPGLFRFVKIKQDPTDMLAYYEQVLISLTSEIEARRQLGIKQAAELAQLRAEQQRIRNILHPKLQEHQLVNQFYISELEAIRNSTSWQLIQPILRLRERLIPINSRREKLLYSVIAVMRAIQQQGILGSLQNAFRWVNFRVQRTMEGKGKTPTNPQEPIKLTMVSGAEQEAPAVRSATLDVIICVHNALPDIQRCLHSVLGNSSDPYHVIVVDDGSDFKTQKFLENFAGEHGCTLIRNEQAKGYTYAANQGMRASSAELVILLNSDTIVTPRWLDKMAGCLNSAPEIGLVGPLSNTASWQSIPETLNHGDWAENNLPPGLSIDQMAAWVEEYSARLYPRLPFLNGFCLLIRRAVIEDIGYFDEENFGQGYGEENDYALRARRTGWQLALADDTYIFHAQSRSYSHAKRKDLSEQSDAILARKYGIQTIHEGVKICRLDPVLEGIRARSKYIFEREKIHQAGSERHHGQSILFCLPIRYPGGGGNIVLTEARAMQRMGVKVTIFNFPGHRKDFEHAYPKLDIPVLYGEPDELPAVAARYDALIATSNPSVTWVLPAAQENPDLITGYYIQDFEPYFYPADSQEYQQATASYTLVPGMLRFAKTEWTRQTVEEQIQAPCACIGPSLDTDLFMPRPNQEDPGWQNRSLRIGAMIRPETEYRSPQLTMEVLKQASQRFGDEIEIYLFGTTSDNPKFSALPQDFPWKNLGLLNPWLVADFLNQIDIFVDYSVYQAMGLTAMEAMACGVATIVPQRGGASSFARPEVNALIVDTKDPNTCYHALVRLIEDHELRQKLQQTALREMPQYFPDGPALQILDLLFGSNH